MKYFDHLFHWCKPYRFLRGGRWCRMNDLAPGGSTMWHRNWQHLGGEATRQLLLSKGVLVEELYS